MFNPAVSWPKLSVVVSEYEAHAMADAKYDITLKNTFLHFQEDPFFEDLHCHCH